MKKTLISPPMRSKLVFGIPHLVSFVATQSINPCLYQDLRYCNISSFRAGRKVGALGVPTQPKVYYIGVNNGGVWKTDNDDRMWQPG